MTATPAIFRLPAAERRAALERFVGQIVGVEVDPLRDGDTKRYRGYAAAIAYPLTGAVVDALILTPVDTEGAVVGTVSYSISAATIRSIRPLGAAR